MKFLLNFFPPLLLANALNVPHMQEHMESNTFFLAYSGAPKTLDPAKSYSSYSNMFIAQIVEPPLGYSYYKRPYTLEPLAAKTMPKVTLLDKEGNVLSDDIKKTEVYETKYDIEIRDDLYYAPHPAFIKPMPNIIPEAQVWDYPDKSTRRVLAKDFVYAIKRLASPKVNSPIYSIMSEHIKGFKDFNILLQKELKLQPDLNKDEVYWNLNSHNISGVTALDDFHFQIRTLGYYKPFIYWLAMSFFAPMPQEVDEFYSRPGLPSSVGHNWSPIGSGPYMITENNPNSRKVLERNPNFHSEFFPNSEDEQDISLGYTKDAGRKLPMVDRFVFSLEKESVSSWNKFLQGYYDLASVNSDNFDQVITLSQQGEVGLSKEMQNKKIRLKTSTQPSLFYIGFNMFDSVVGGSSERARLLRQAISIAINQEEFISIFMNGRGVPAHGPIPENIWGGGEIVNSYVYDDKVHRKSIDYAKSLMSQAGYKNGLDPKTNAPLVLTFDTTSSSSSDDKSRFNWYRSQFAKIGIKLDIEATQYNRFQDKMRKGNAQIFNWGWYADYPDPENFLFLLYGPNGKVKYHGENAANYSNPDFDKCFEQMRDLPNNEKRRQLIHKCITILQYDSPWVWGFSPSSFSLSHEWQNIRKPNSMLNNYFKYIRLDHNLRAKKQDLWNKPNNNIFLSISLFVLILLLLMFCMYQHSQEKPSHKKG